MGDYNESHRGQKNYSCVVWSHFLSRAKKFRRSEEIYRFICIHLFSICSTTINAKYKKASWTPTTETRFLYPNCYLFPVCWKYFTLFLCVLVLKDHVEIGHLNKYDAFRMNRDQVMDLEIWFKIHTNFSNFETASPKITDFRDTL